MNWSHSNVFLRLSVSYWVDELWCDDSNVFEHFLVSSKQCFWSGGDSYTARFLLWYSWGGNILTLICSYISVNDLIGTLFSFSFSLTHVFEMFSLISFFLVFYFCVFSICKCSQAWHGQWNGLREFWRKILIRVQKNHDSFGKMVWRIPSSYYVNINRNIRFEAILLRKKSVEPFQQIHYFIIPLWKNILHFVSRQS